MINKQKVFIAALAMTITQGFTSTASAAAALSRDELKIGISQEFESLNPLVMSMAASTYMFSLVGRTMDTLNSDGKWVPQLAKSIPTMENKGAQFVTLPDGKKTVVATWEILEKASWGDGVPVTCEDFAFAREVASNPNVSVASKETYTSIEKIEWDVKTPKKCKMTMDKARWDFNQMPSFNPLPKHIEEAIYKKFSGQKEGYETNSAYNKNSTNPGLYNGPYVVTEVKLGSHIAFAVNPKFYGPAPKFKKILIKYIPSTATLEANLRSGTIDMISPQGITFDQALSLEKKVKAENLPFKVVFKPSLTYEHIDLNLDNPILKDVKVRKAMVYSLNREDLVNALFEGKQKVAIHNLATIDPWYTADPKLVTLYPYNKREAARLLDEAGWKMGADGYRYKDGQKLSLKFQTTAGNKNREVVQTYIQGQWKGVGIEVVIKNEPARVFFSETTNKRKFDLAMYAWISSPESSPKSTLHTSNIPSQANTWSGQNNMGWSNPKVDSLIDQLEGEFDAKKRKNLAQQILKFYTDEVPVIPLYYRSDIAVPPAKLSGFKLPGHQFSETNEAETWDLL